MDIQKIAHRYYNGSNIYYDKIKKIDNILLIKDLKTYAVHIQHFELACCFREQEKCLLKRINKIRRVLGLEVLETVTHSNIWRPDEFDKPSEFEDLSQKMKDVRNNIKVLDMMLDPSKYRIKKILRILK